MNVLEAKDLSFAYGNTPVLDAASFTMCEGGFAALVGVNGAGKSTLLRLLLGELKPTGGHIALMGQDIGSFKSWQRIGYVPQDGLTRKESFPASVNEVVLANLYSRIGLFRFPRREHREDVRRTLELVGMQDYGCRMLGELSGGQRQRVQLAQALVSRPPPCAEAEPPCRLFFRELGYVLGAGYFAACTAHSGIDTSSPDFGASHAGDIAVFYCHGFV